MKKNIKKVTAEEMRALLKNNRVTILRGLLQLYSRQTPNERKIRSSILRNCKGFNYPDARIMTEYAIFYIKNGFVTELQYEDIKKRIQKYASQLTRIVNGVL